MPADRSHRTSDFTFVNFTESQKHLINQNNICKNERDQTMFYEIELFKDEFFLAILGIFQITFTF